METLPQLSKARLQALSRLHLRRHRDKERRFLAEGIRIVRELLTSPYSVELLVCTKEAETDHSELIATFRMRGVPCVIARDSDFVRLADTSSPQGLLAVVAYPPTNTPPELGAASWVALNGINDPGNAGTIVRTAHWFGYAGIVLSRGSIDRYQPKFVRATMGALFHLAVIETELEPFLDHARRTHRIIGAVSHSGIPLEQYAPPAQPHVLIIGSEAHGLSCTVEERLDDRITIPSKNHFDSLNAAVAAGIVMYHLCTRS
jgi:TrmH family RNA methyltransferase